MKYLSSKLVPKKVAYLRLATNCNANCKMCNLCRTRPAQIDSAILSKIFQKLAALGYSEVIFTGGEPLIADCVDQAVASARRCDLRARCRAQLGPLTRWRWAEVACPAWRDGAQLSAEQGRGRPAAGEADCVQP